MKGLLQALYSIAFIALVCHVRAQDRSFILQLHQNAESSLNSGDYSDALLHALHATRLSDSLSNCNLQAESYRQVGMAQDYLKNRNAAFVWLNKSLAACNSCEGSDTIRMRTWRYLGAMYFGSQQADSSIFFLESSARLMQKFGYSDEAASAYGMLGETYSTIVHDPIEATRHYQESIRLAKLSQTKKAIGYAMFRYGCHLARNEKCLIGKPYIDSSYAIFTSLHDTEGMRWALNGLAYAETDVEAASWFTIISANSRK